MMNLYVSNMIVVEKKGTFDVFLPFALNETGSETVSKSASNVEIIIKSF